MKYIDDLSVINIAKKINVDLSVVYNIKHCYFESHRHYHNWSHILNGLYHFDTKYNGNIPKEIFIAWLFHDAVYIPSSKTNEEDSVKLYQLYKNKLNNVNHNLVQKYILATKMHTCNEDNGDLAFFLDVDMSYLGENNERFKICRLNVREEYKLVDDKTFDFYSVKFYKELLKKEFIFITKDFRYEYESRCRENIIKSIEEMS